MGIINLQSLGKTEEIKGKRDGQIIPSTLSALT